MSDMGNRRQNKGDKVNASFLTGPIFNVLKIYFSIWLKADTGATSIGRWGMIHRARANLVEGDML